MSPRIILFSKTELENIKLQKFSNPDQPDFLSHPLSIPVCSVHGHVLAEPQGVIRQ